MLQEKEITSAPPHTGDAKGGGKKGITSVKILQGALDRKDIQGLGAFSLTHEETGERTSKKHNCYGDLKHWTHSARRRDKRNYKPHFQLHRTSLR